MASPNNIKLSVSDAPVFSFNPKVETAEKASELMQKDEQEHNIYFNDSGFHSQYFLSLFLAFVLFPQGKLLESSVYNRLTVTTDHIDHHVLSIYALGASPEDVEHAYASGSSYQRPALPVDKEVVKRLNNQDEFRKLAGKREHYPNFLHFFKQELESKGVGSVVHEYLFAGGEFADEMLARLFGGA